MQRKRPFSSSPSLKCALREIDCRINYEPKNESRSLLAVDIQGYQRGGFCIVADKFVPFFIF